MYYLVFKYSYMKNGRVHTETYSDLDKELVEKIVARYENNLREGEFYSLDIERGEMYGMHI